MNKINHLSKNEINIYSIKREFIKNNKLILQIQQTFKSEMYSIFTEETNQIALSSTDDKRMQSIGSIKTYAYGTSKDLSEKEKKRRLNIIT